MTPHMAIPMHSAKVIEITRRWKKGSTKNDQGYGGFFVKVGILARGTGVGGNGELQEMPN